MDTAAQGEQLPGLLRLEKALVAASVAWWEMDCPSGAVRFHPRKAEMLGYEPEAFTHYTHFTALVHPEDVETAMSAMRGHLEGVLPEYRLDYRIRNRDGTYRWFQDVGCITERDADGRPAVVTGVVFDISQRKRAEASLRQHEQSLVHGERFAQFGHWELSLQDLVVHVSQGTARIYGLTGLSHPLADVQQLAVPEDRPRLEAALRNLVEGDVPYDLECWIHRASDGAAVAVHSRAEVDRATRRVFGVVQDVTTRKRAEAERETLILQLQSAIEHIKTLKGILPICASCKKIRDDKGYWQQVDSYLARHTDVRFSHGICPECVKKHYPEV